MAAKLHYVPWQRLLADVGRRVHDEEKDVSVDSVVVERSSFSRGTDYDYHNHN
jgi:hypothetical protein